MAVALGGFRGLYTLLNLVEVPQDCIRGFLQVGFHTGHGEVRPRHVGIVTDGVFEGRQWWETSSGMKILDECGHGPNGVCIPCSMLGLHGLHDGLACPLCWNGEQVQVACWVHDTSKDMFTSHGGHVYLVPTEGDLAPCLA